jgi:hypothetical protein
MFCLGKTREIGRHPFPDMRYPHINQAGEICFQLASPLALLLVLSSIVLVPAIDKDRQPRLSFLWRMTTFLQMEASRRVRNINDHIGIKILNRSEAIDRRRYINSTLSGSSSGSIADMPNASAFDN